jgi:NAD(P)-dependent dehydrogenase (short-subunit alcohol dehydrogenase family)
MNILITGTSSGIGAELFNKLSADNTVICGNRTITNTSDIQLDMSSQKSIMEFVGNLTENNKKFDMVILNAGTKATRKRVDWNGKKLNMCRVVNLLANDYLLTQMKIHNLISTDAKIVFMTSITHWSAENNPCPPVDGVDGDPDDAAWANQQYPNTKFGLFVLGKKLKKMNTKYDIILCNPGMVATKIFGDKTANGLIPSSIRYVREMLSMTPNESADYIVKSIMTENTENKVFRYFTPYQSPALLGFFEKTQMLQDVLGHRLLSRTNSDTDNFSKRVMDDVVEQNYEKYLS